MSNPYDFVTTGRQAKPRKVLVYGEPGVGKTTAASQWPSAVMLDVERGSSDVDVARLPKVTTYEDVAAMLKATPATDDKGSLRYKTLVIDGLGTLQSLIETHVCKQNSVSAIDKIGYGKGYAFAVQHWREMLAELDRISESGMHLVLIAHGKRVKRALVTGDEFDTWDIDLRDKDILPMVKRWATEIVFAHFEEIAITKPGSGFDAEERRLTTTGRRIMGLVKTQGYDAKKRLKELPELAPLGYEAFGQVLDADNETATNIDKEKAK